jgi:hypothetical protein
MLYKYIEYQMNTNEKVMSTKFVNLIKIYICCFGQLFI